MTNDWFWQVVAEPDDMERTDSPCHWCLKDVKDKCKDKLISIITQKPIDDKIDYSLLLKKYNNGEKQNARSDIQDRTQQGRTQSFKKHR